MEAEIKALLTTKMGVDEEPTTVERVVDGRGDNKKLVFVRLTLSSYESKQVIMKNKNKLKGTKIYMDYDLTKQEGYV